MIKVVFKSNKQKGFYADEFTYKSYIGNEVGDIIVVNTRYGYAIAKVVAIDIYDSQFNEDNLAQVVCTVYSAAQARAEQTRKDMQELLIANIKKRKARETIEAMNLSADEMKIVNDMNDTELIAFSKALGNI